MSAVLLVACRGNYEYGDVEPVKTRIGGDRVTLCIDVRVHPDMNKYIDFTTFPDMKLETFQRELAKRMMSEVNSGWAGSDPRFQQPLACRTGPPSFASERSPSYPIPHTDEVKEVWVRGMYSVHYNYYARGDRVVFIDGRLHCPRTSTCAFTREELSNRPTDAIPIEQGD